MLKSDAAHALTVSPPNRDKLMVRDGLRPPHHEVQAVEIARLILSLSKMGNNSRLGRDPGIKARECRSSSLATARHDSIEPRDVALRPLHKIARARLPTHLQRRCIIFPCRFQRRAALRSVRLRLPLAQRP